MCVEQFRCPHVLFSNDGADACQGQFQFFRFRSEGQKQSVLDAAGLDRFGGECDFHDGGWGAMRIQVQLEQFQQNLGIPDGDRKSEFACEITGLVFRFGFHCQFEVQFVGGQVASPQSLA